jgi:drug/metabolite transporter (DMT)-like permease
MSDHRLGTAQILLLVAYAFAMAGGQLLFKLAAQQLTPGATLAERLIELAGNVWFYAAFALYCALALAWIWILTFTPLSRAYAFVALAFAITPLLGAWVFAEPVGWRLVGGIALIAMGLLFVVG